MTYTLPQACTDEGFTLEICERPAKHPNRISPLFWPWSDAMACSGKVIACVDDSWDNAYAVAHEIAKTRHGLKHTAEMFSEQANIMARWIKQLAIRQGGGDT